RRRHTRFSRDWSSDVCSSDLGGDGLVYAGAEGVQLTWMDAKVGDWVVTPRRGAPVEINALWYNALRSVETLARKLGRTDAAEWERLARAVRSSFLQRFTRPDGGLWDVVAGDGRSEEHTS